MNPRPGRALSVITLPLVIMAWVAVADEPPSLWDDPEAAAAAAAADSLAALGPVTSVFDIEVRLAALSDSLITAGTDAADAEQILAAREAEMQAQLDAAAAAAAEVAGDRWFFDCNNVPEAGVQANVTRVNYFGRLANTVRVIGGGQLSDSYGWNQETYRRQERTVENRSARGSYDSGKQLPLQLNAQVSLEWSEDITTNAGGNTNVNQREIRRGGMSASKTGIAVGPTRHGVTGSWFQIDQQSVNQQQLNNFNEGEIAGAIRSGLQITEGLTLATRIYGIKRDGESLLADIQSPSTTTGDTLGVGAYYSRDVVQGRLTVTQSNFDRRYLDYRRNSNGLIDTVNVPEGASKIVRELEAKDALHVLWENAASRGRYQLTARVEHTADTQQYTFSQVGRRDRSRDAMTLKAITPVGRDSFVLNYRYEWSWDDQRLLGATASRGRQYRKVRDVSVDWQRRLFRRTTISGRYRTELSQDIAENQYNENDRDRLTEEGRLKLDARWQPRFSTSLMTEYQRVEDVAIRASRSANNNVRRTFEVAPSYRYAFSQKVELAQVFRMYIQYQDHAFAYLPEVRKDDTFNKRGNLATTVTLKPNARLDIVVKHDYNQRYNGTRTDRDAAGNTFYRRDQQQSISRVELGLTWTALAWSKNETLKFQTASYRTLDSVDRFGTTTTRTERYSGELWLGATFNRKWGPPDSPLGLDARVRRYLAYGPNVTETSRDYWEADVKLSWAF